MEKTLVFPDLHQPAQDVLDNINKTIEKNRPCDVVFLGDYFDNYDDTPMDALRMANWLVDSLKDQTRTHLLGNHDMAYFYPGSFTSCSEFGYSKKVVIDKVLGRHINKFKFFSWIGDILLTHAGLSKNILDYNRIHASSMKAVYRMMSRESERAAVKLKGGGFHWFAAVSRIRGGYNRAGGIFWGDLTEFVPVPGIRQIFGHTADGPRWIDADHRNLLLDSRDGYPYAIVNGKSDVTISAI
jgi:hypothetical protein